VQLVTFESVPERDLSDGERSSHTFADASLGFEGLGFGRPGLHRLGALLPPGPCAGDVVDLNRALAVKLAFEDVGAPEVEADSLLPADMLSFLQRGAQALASARQALTWTLDVLSRYDGPDLVRADVVIPRRAVKLNAPILRPGKLVGVARNYASHAAERRQAERSSELSPELSPELSKEPVLFLKAPTSVIGPTDDIVIPRASQQVDFEGELAVVIGSAAHRIESPDALSYVAGYTVANDVTARDFQNVRGQHFIGKSCDTFAPMGPALVTQDEIPDPQTLSIQTRVSGTPRQSAATGEMIFSIAEIIAFASRLMTLEPGDVILTGTPAGVGAASDPPVWLEDGDIVDIEIEGLGRLRNFVREEAE
jgi:acylpyruvate hydrolase